MKIKKGDKVKVIAGDDKGVVAEVVQLFLDPTVSSLKVSTLSRDIRNRTTPTLTAVSSTRNYRSRFPM